MKIAPIQRPIYSASKVNQKQDLPLANESKITPSFKSLPLYKVAAIKREDNCSTSRIPAYFSRLSPEDHSDYFTIVELGNRLVQGDRYGTQICCNFRYQPPKEVHFFAIETKEHGIPLKDRIISLAQVNIYDNGLQNRYNPGKRYMEIALIQSMKEIPCTKFTETKGGGELCLYGLVRLAKERNLDYVTLSSTSNSFYDHIQFGEKSSHTRSTNYELKKDSYNYFLKRVEQKYGF